MLQLQQLRKMSRTIAAACRSLPNMSSSFAVGRDHMSVMRQTCAQKAGPGHYRHGQTGRGEASSSTTSRAIKADRISVYLH